MKDRSEVVAFIDAQLDDMTPEIERAKHRRHHYGRQELKALLDFIYGDLPMNDAEKLAELRGTKY